MKTKVVLEDSHYLIELSPPYSKQEQELILRWCEATGHTDENYLGETPWSLKNLLASDQFQSFCLLFRKTTFFKKDIFLGGAGLRESENTFLISRLFSNSKAMGVKFCVAYMYPHFFKTQEKRGKRFLVFSINTTSRLDDSIGLKMRKKERGKSYLLWKSSLQQFTKMEAPVEINRILQFAYVRDLQQRPQEWLKLGTQTFGSGSASE